MPLDTLQGQALLVDELLKRDHRQSLEALLRARRELNESFDAIARELTALIQIPNFTVSYGTIRRWCIRFGIDQEAAS